MECNVCTQDLDGGLRAPKSLPCGHTCCLQCLGRLPDSRCPTCRQNFNGPPEGLPTNFAILQLLEERGLDSPPRGWCSDCRSAATSRCWEDHDVLPVRSALRRQLQRALPQAAEQLQGLQDQCREEQALPALTLLTGESWDVTLRGGGRELTGTLRDAEEPLTKALCLLLAARAALTEDRAAARNPPTTAAPTPPAAAPPPPAAASTPAASTPAAAAPTPAAAPLAALSPPPAEAPPPREMNVKSISCSGPNDDQQQKAAALRDAPGVTRLVHLRCHTDPAWSLRLLQLAAPSLEQLSLHDPGEAHLRAVHAMPRLTRLEVSCEDDALDAQPPVLPELPWEQAGLRWLSVYRLPSVTLQSLLRAHGRSLEELQLDVGTGAGGWPWHCQGLHSLLEPCELRSLWSLVLKRAHVFHQAPMCYQQLAEVKGVLPRTEVLCEWCDGVNPQPF
ncbi:uncharacterized protein LOC113209402 [Frankliniella occidentalis]|uniref:Uncharacterized protein LOC113209402 n=1 Tax=Frankliniella occidentalis TaxID=133901 RepID=A0A6J1SPE9_FRAOC|nr:uncharacterized protein LOC113209402 [Frankliniella occidentalis]XP_026282674.1 uncharacterized protein LOC113209402 [Frankliniella occidentalis]